MPHPNPLRKRERGNIVSALRKPALELPRSARTSEFGSVVCASRYASSALGGHLLAGNKSSSAIRDQRPLAERATEWHTAQLVLAHRIAQARARAPALQVSGEDRPRASRGRHSCEARFVPAGNGSDPWWTKVRRFRTMARYAVVRASDTVTRKYPWRRRASALSCWTWPP